MKYLTKNNIDYLRKQGYLYLLGQTQNLPDNSDSDISTRIVLTPTKLDMNVELMPSKFDCYFNLNNDEAMDIANGQDAVEFLIREEN